MAAVFLAWPSSYIKGAHQAQTEVPCHADNVDMHIRAHFTLQCSFLEILGAERHDSEWWLKVLPFDETADMGRSMPRVGYMQPVRVYTAWKERFGVDIESYMGPRLNYMCDLDLQRPIAKASLAALTTAEGRL